jgi:pyruvate/2-oxoglutarate/acetoin dehydrogenase E1 component
VSQRRMVGDLNQALLDLADADERLYFLGEDIGDPYGGAFKVTRGLSTRHPDRVLSTPISEGAIVGVAGGLALRGNRVIVEVMFGDFIGLCFDSILNFVSKSVTMYGQRLDMPVVVRCPVGGRRGYGPTHSQNLQKHLVGIPNLTLFEMSPFHDNRAVFETMLALREPCVFFEEKSLYTEPPYTGGRVDDLLRYDYLDPQLVWARTFVDGIEHPDCVLIAPGGLTGRALAAMRAALLTHEVVSQLLTPSRLYPLDMASVLPLVYDAGVVCVAEDGVDGGTWGREIAGLLYERAWGRLRAPIRLVHPERAVIPAARHLEDAFSVTKQMIHDALVECVRG